MKAWEVMHKQEEWSVIVHADTRGKAIVAGQSVGADDFIELSARRLPLIDDKPVTKELMIESGWREGLLDSEMSGANDYTFPCGCEHCKA